jgi:type IV secretory pathway VirB10-like protein
MIPNNTSGIGQATPSAGNATERLDIHGTPPAVTRVSRRAVLLAGVFGASLGLVVLMLGFGSHSAPRKDGPIDDNAIRPSGPIESVKDLPNDYTFDVNRLGRGVGYEALTGQAGENAATRPGGLSPQEQAFAQAMRELIEQRRKLLEQQQKEEQAALDSPLLFGGAKSGTPSFVTTPGPTTMPSLAMLGPDGHRTDMMDAGGGEQDASGLGVGPSGDGIQNHQQEKEEFLTQGAAVEPYLSKPLLNPISKYELKAGSVIPGALVTAINTDLPGEVIGQVTENVYDSVSGNYLLIPQGSKLLGKYQSLVTNGQNRALVVWQRLIYPNGNSIVLDGMPGTDEAGMAGLQDQVDYHLDKLAEATALSTALAYAGNLARNPNSSTGNNGQDVIGDSVAQQANRIGEKLIDRELDVQSTITIRPGWPLRVLVNKDMILAPYVP